MAVEHLPPVAFVEKLVALFEAKDLAAMRAIMCIQFTSQRDGTTYRLSAGDLDVFNMLANAGLDPDHGHQFTHQDRAHLHALTEIIKTFAGPLRRIETEDPFA